MFKGSKTAISATAKQKDKQQGDKKCEVKKISMMTSAKAVAMNARIAKNR